MTPGERELVKYELGLLKQIKSAKENGDKPTQLRLLEALDQFKRESTSTALPESAGDRATIGFGKSFIDTARGARQLFGDGSVNKEIAESRKLDIPLMGTTSGMVGNIAGQASQMIPFGMAKGAATALGAAALGGGFGALQPVADGESRAVNAGLGAAGGVAGKYVGDFVGRALTPSDEAASLLKKGVKLTPGQQLGGAAKRIEDSLTSMPVLGDAISNAQNRSLESFNKAVFDDVLRPIGRAVTQAGNKGLQEALDAADDAYRAVLPNINVKPDNAFISRLRTIGQDAKLLPPERAKQFEKIIQDKVLRHFSRSGQMTGETFKREADAEIGRLAASFKASADADQRQLGALLSKSQEALRDLVTRNTPDPKIQSALKQANETYGLLKRIEEAVKRAGADKDGIFTPAQLFGAAKAMDRSFSKRAFARGQAALQQQAVEGAKTLPSKVADSGTPMRTLVNVGVLGGGAAINPWLLAPVAAGVIPYSAAGGAVTRGMLRGLPLLAPYAGLTARTAGPAAMLQADQ